MESGRKPKRRIIDSTSVPTSRRASYKHRECRDNIKHSKEDTTQKNVKLESSNGRSHSVDNCVQHAKNTKVPDVSPEALHEQTDNVFYEKQNRENSYILNDKPVSPHKEKETVLSKTDQSDVILSDTMLGLSKEKPQTTLKQIETVQKQPDMNIKQPETDTKQETHKKQPDINKKQHEIDVKQPYINKKLPETDMKQEETCENLPETDVKQLETDENQQESDTNLKHLESVQKQQETIPIQEQPDTDIKQQGITKKQTKTVKQLDTIQKQPDTERKEPETSHKQSDNIQKQLETVHNQPETDNKQPETDKKQETIQKQLVIGDNLKPSLQKTEVVPMNNVLRVHECFEATSGTKAVESNENASSKENDCFENKDTMDDNACSSPNNTEFNVLNKKVQCRNELRHSIYNMIGYNRGSVNPLLGIPEESNTYTDQSHSIDLSSMFETETIPTGKDEMHGAEDKFVAEMTKTEDEFRRPSIIVSDFFGDGDMLSSIRNDSTVDLDLLDGNIACHRGLSLFDEPKVIAENSKYFKFVLPGSIEKHGLSKQKNTNHDRPENKDPFSIELEMTTPLVHEGIENQTVSMADIYDAVFGGYTDSSELDNSDGNEEDINKDVYSSLMEGSGGNSRLLSVEEKWQIIFNEKTRAPIFAVTQYIDYLNQFVNGQNVASRDKRDVIKKDSIHPISYLLRKLKLDLKMSYDSFVEEFIKPSNSGIGLLIKLLKSIQNTGSQQSGSANMTQLKNYKKTLTDEHDCLLCIKYSLRLKKSLSVLFDINYGLEIVTMGVISTYTKSRGTAIEILTICLSSEEGFSRTLDCFTYIQLKIGEPVRFKSLVNMINMDSQHNTIFKVCTMKFLNSLLDASTNTNIRVFLQHELETAGLDIDYMEQKATGTGLEFDDLRHELTEWKRKYVNVDTILSQQNTIGYRTQQPANQQMVVDLQTQLKKMSTDKAYLEYQLQAVSTELRNRYEQLLKHTPIKQDACTQSNIQTSEKSVACQCDPVPKSDSESDAPLKTAADYFGWKDVYIDSTQDTYHPACGHEYSEQRHVNDMEHSQDTSTSDDEGVVKVQHWLRSHCGSSENENKLLPGTDDPSVSGCSSFYFKRNSLTRRKVQKTEFPGNWKLIPKSLEQFPSRFPPQQCHQTNCDRCDLRNRTENANHKQTPVVKNFELEVRLNELVKTKKRSDVRSQSSDSAIGGSGEERLWSERRIPLVPAETTEAEILQDMIQPDDSASGCPTSEPYPDYSLVESKFGTQKSFRTELSQVLREFEGNLLKYDSPAKTKVGEIENYITLGEI